MFIIRILKCDAHNTYLSLRLYFMAPIIKCLKVDQSKECVRTDTGFIPYSSNQLRDLSLGNGPTSSQFDIFYLTILSEKCPNQQYGLELILFMICYISLALLSFWVFLSGLMFLMYFFSLAKKSISRSRYIKQKKSKKAKSYIMQSTCKMLKNV